MALQFFFYYHSLISFPYFATDTDTTSPSTPSTTTRTSCRSDADCGTTKHICLQGQCTNPCLVACGTRDCSISIGTQNEVKINCHDTSKTEPTTTPTADIGKTLSPKEPTHTVGFFTDKPEVTDRPQTPFGFSTTFSSISPGVTPSFTPATPREPSVTPLVPSSHKTTRRPVKGSTRRPPKINTPRPRPPFGVDVSSRRPPPFFTTPPKELPFTPASPEETPTHTTPTPTRVTTLGTPPVTENNTIHRPPTTPRSRPITPTTKRPRITIKRPLFPKTSPHPPTQTDTPHTNPPFRFTPKTPATPRPLEPTTTPSSSVPKTLAPGPKTCTSSVECPRNLACLQNKCTDPCKMSSPCGSGFTCQVISNRLTCQCPTGPVLGSRCPEGNNHFLSQYMRRKQADNPFCVVVAVFVIYFSLRPLPGRRESFSPGDEFSTSISSLTKTKKKWQDRVKTNKSHSDNNIFLFFYLSWY